MPFVFSYEQPKKWKKTSEARIAQAVHSSNIDELLSPEPSHQELELEPLTKEVAYSVVSIYPLYTSVKTFLIELPTLSRRLTRFMIIYWYNMMSASRLISLLHAPG